MNGSVELQDMDFVKGKKCQEGGINSHIRSVAARPSSSHIIIQ